MNTDCPFKRGDRVQIASSAYAFRHLRWLVNSLQPMTVVSIRAMAGTHTGWLVTVRVGWWGSRVYFRDYDTAWFEQA